MSLLRKASIVTTPTSYENGKILSVKPSVVLGQELVTNGDFATDSDWNIVNNAGTASEIINGYARIKTDGAYTQIDQPSVTIAAKSYKLQYTILESDGGVLGFITTGNQTVSIPTTVGTHIYYFVAHSTSIVFKRLSGALDVKIDNVSVKEAIDADFDFTRNSSATRTNSQGLIEDITANLPRIDYTGGEGHWLFEPQSTNLITQSELFSDSYWTKSGSSVVSGFISPDGTSNAFKLVENTATTTHQVVRGFSYLNAKYSLSVFLKADERNWIKINLYDGTSSVYAYFDLTNGVVGQELGASGKIENYGNGWYRCSMSTTSVVSLGSGNISFRLAEFDGGTGYTGNGTSGLYIFGAQLEQQSYSTSYIPTNGEVNGVTRLADAAFGAGSTDLINSTEGTLYAEIAALADDNIARNISLGSGDRTNTVEIFYGTSTNQISFKIRANNSNVTVQNRTVSDRTQFAKVAIKYKSGDIEFFINGVKEVDRTDNFTFSGSLSELAFDRGDGSDEFEGKVKCVAVFKEALTDAELICLTTI